MKWPSTWTTAWGPLRKCLETSPQIMLSVREIISYYLMACPLKLFPSKGTLYTKDWNERFHHEFISRFTFISEPGDIQGLSTAYTSPSSIEVKWMLPCPPLAPIKYYQYGSKRWSWSGWSWSSLTELQPCQSNPNWYCHTFSQLTENWEYTLYVSNLNTCSGIT